MYRKQYRATAHKISQKIIVSPQNVYDGQTDGSDGNYKRSMVTKIGPTDFKVRIIQLLSTLNLTVSEFIPSLKLTICLN